VRRFAVAFQLLPKFYRVKIISTALPRGTSFAIRAFDSVTQETTMSFSMPSYFLGVGTVVGALALGFGGGIVLTKTAIKDTPSGPSKIERAARSEPGAATPQVTEAKAVPVPRAEPWPVVQSTPAPVPVQAGVGTAPQVQAAAEPAKPIVEAPRAEPAKAAEPVKPVEPVRQVEAVKPVEPLKQAEPAKQADMPKQADMAAQAEQKQAEQRKAERKIEREKRIAERKARAMAMARTKPRVIEVQEEPARSQLAFEREEPRPNFFEGLFGRPEAVTIDRRE
jgi:hypothetical protein